MEIYLVWGWGIWMSYLYFIEQAACFLRWSFSRELCSALRTRDIDDSGRRVGRVWMRNLYVLSVGKSLCCSPPFGFEQSVLLLTVPGTESPDSNPDQDSLEQMWDDKQVLGSRERSTKSSL